ncbi:MAG: hypothetical protein P4L99_01065 [Chthoniobacter sp.]|nr:hypothetical protein [Chthoniobacter sp.]
MCLLGKLHALLNDTRFEIQPGIQGGQFLPRLQKCVGELGGVGLATATKRIDIIPVTKADRFFQPETKSAEDREIAIAPFESARRDDLLKPLIAGQKPLD